VKLLTTVVMFIVTSIVVFLNPDVINMIETVCGPLIAIFLFVIPTWLVLIRPVLKRCAAQPQ
jgi:serine transporter